MGSPSRTPELKGTSVVASGNAVITFSQAMGAVYVRNRGVGTAFIAFNTSSPPTASTGDGRLGLATGQSINLDDVYIDKIAISNASGSDTNEIDAVGVPRPGNNSGGAL